MADDGRFILLAEIDASGSVKGSKKFQQALEDMVRLVKKTSQGIDKLDGTIDSLVQAELKAAKQSEKLKQEVLDLKASHTRLEAELQDTRKELDQLRQSKGKTEKQAKALQARIVSLTVKLAALVGGIAAIRRAFLSAVTAAIQYESGLAGVSKTTDIVGQDLANLGAEITNLATTKIPAATSELLDIAQGAGQLGVKGSDNILAFVSAVGKVVPSTDLAADTAATSFARILNVTDEALTEVERFASQIVALGNAFPAVESEILHTTNEVARATAQFGVGSGAAAAWATALAAMGVQAEAAGTSVNRLFQTVQKAVFAGGASLETMAQVAQTSVDEFVRVFEEDAQEAVILFLRGLEKLSDRDRQGVLDQFQLTSARLNKVIPLLVDRIEILDQTLFTVREDAVAATNALDREFARFAATTESQIQLAKNALGAIGVALGAELLPVINEILTATREWLLENRDVAASIGETLAGAIRLVAPLMELLVDHMDDLVALAAALAVAKIATVLASIELSVVGLTAAVRALNLAFLSNPLFAVAAISTFVGVKLFQILRSEVRETERAVADLTAEVELTGGAFERLVSSARSQNIVREIGRLEEQLAKAKTAGDKEAIKSLQERIRLANKELNILKLQSVTRQSFREDEKRLGELSVLVNELRQEEKKREQALKNAEELQKKIGRGADRLVEKRREELAATSEILEQKELELSTLRSIVEKSIEHLGVEKEIVETRGGDGGFASEQERQRAAIEARLKAIREEIEELEKKKKLKEQDLKLDREIKAALEETLRLSDATVTIDTKLEPLTDEELEALRTQLEGTIDEERFGEVLDNLAEGLQDALSDSLEVFFKEGLDGFEEFFESIHDLVINIFAETLATELSDVLTKQFEEIKRKFSEARQGGATRGEAFGAALSGTGGIVATAGIVAANIIASDNKAAAAAATAIGTAIGFAIGTYVFPVVLGPALGAQLGAVFGSILGTFIKSGTPEFFASVEAELGSVTFGESGMGRGFQRVAGTVGKEIREGVDQVLRELGASLEGIGGDITLKLKNGLSVFLGGQEFDFGDEIAAGMEFAIVETLKRADLSGIEPEVARALQFSGADSIQELLSDLAFARDLARQSLDDVAKTILEFVDQAEAAASRARDLGLSDDPVFAMFGEQLATLRDQILGIQENPAERIRRQSEAFNRRVQLLEAEEKVKQAELELRRAELQAEVDMLLAEQRLAGERINLNQLKIDAEQQTLSAETEMLRAKLAQLAAVEAALNAASGILDNLPDLISDADIAGAIGRIGGGGGRRQRREDIRRSARETRFRGLDVGGVVSAQAQFEDMQEQIRRAGFSAEESARLIEIFARAVEDAEESAARSIQSRIDALGGTGGLSDTLASIERESRLLARELEALAELGLISAEGLDRLNGELERNSQIAQERAVSQAADSLLIDLLEMTGREEEAAQLRHDLAVLDLQIRREELRLAQERFGIEIEAFGRISELVDEVIEGGLPGLSGDNLGSIMDEIRNLGGDAGGLLQDMQAINNAADDLRQRLQRLADAGTISAREMREASEALEESARAARSAGAAQSAGNLLVDLLEMAGEEEEAARIRFEFTLAELELRREELRLALARTDIEAQAAAQILEVLQRSGVLLERIRRIGPRTRGTSGGGGSPRDDNRAQELLERLREEQLDRFVQQVRQINGQFEFLRDELGNTAEIANLHAQALQDAIDEINASARSFLEELDFTSPSRDPLERFQDLEEATREAVATALGDPTNSEARQRAEDLLRQLFGMGQDILPTAGGGFADLEEFIRQSLAALMDIDIDDLEDLGSAPNAIDAGSQAVVDAIRDQTDRLTESERETGNIITEILTRAQREALAFLGDDLISAIDLQGDDFTGELGNLQELFRVLTDEQIDAFGGIEGVLFEILGPVQWQRLIDLGLLDDILSVLIDTRDFMGLVFGGGAESPIPDPTPAPGPSTPTGGPVGTDLLIQSSQATERAVSSQTRAMVPIMSDIRDNTALSASELRTIRQILSKPTSTNTGISTKV